MHVERRRRRFRHDCVPGGEGLLRFDNLFGALPDQISLTSGVQVGSETVAVADDAHSAELIALTTWNVQASLQAWSNGDSNLGWAIFNSDTDAIEFTSSEDSTAGLRPLLTVDFTPVPEPGSLVLAGLAGAGALCVRRLRRSLAR